MQQKKQAGWLTAPNLLSLVRILLIPVFLGVMLLQKAASAFAVFLLAASTDFFDGIAARLFRQKTRLGAYLDPAADKLLMTAAFVVLSLPSLNTANVIPLWLTAVVIGRDILIVSSALILFLSIGQQTFTPTLTGKVCTAFQMGVLLLVLFFNALKTSPPYLRGLFILTLLLTIVSAFHYGAIGLQMISAARTSARRTS